MAANGPVGSTSAGGCAGKPDAMGVSRVVEIDPADGPYYGVETKFPRKPSFLKQKEIVLTFDDGPMPWITKSILDTLDTFCVKATFFSIGQMAQNYPNWINEELARGHTVGTHSWSHPLPFNRLSEETQHDQIERGFAAVSSAAKTPIAPFFRFPGLGDSTATLAYLKERHIATFTVDVVSNDSYTADPDKLIQQTLEKIEARNWGSIVLFHDIKASTAKALPTFLRSLKERGYKIVHMVSKTPYQPNPLYAGKLKPLPAKTTLAAAGSSEAKLPFYGVVKPGGLGPASAPKPVRTASAGGSTSAAKGYAADLPWAPKGTDRGFDSSAPRAAQHKTVAHSATPTSQKTAATKPKATNQAPKTTQWTSGGWLTTIFSGPPQQPAAKKQNKPQVKKPVDVSSSDTAATIKTSGLGARPRE